MPGTRYDLTRSNNLGEDHPIEQGAAFGLTITVKDDGSARDLTGHVVRFAGWDEWEGTQIFAFNSDNDSEISLTPASGIISVSIADSTTKGYTARTEELEDREGNARQVGVYRLDLEDASGANENLLWGDLEIVPGTTI